MYVAIKEDVAGDDISNIVKTLVVSGGIMVLTLTKLLFVHFNNLLEVNTTEPAAL